MTDIVDEAKELIPYLGDDSLVEKLTKEVERLREDNKRLRDRMEKVSDILYDKGELDTWAAVRNALWQDGE